MKPADIRSIVEEYYPNCTGIILSGSQVNNNEFNDNTDIDVLIIDPSASVAAAHMQSHHQYRFDFTLIPTLDIENVLQSEMYDVRGTVLVLFKIGIILKDTNEIAQKAKAKAIELYNLATEDKERKFKYIIKDLLRVRKAITRNISREEKIVLLSDFIMLMTKMRLYQSENHMPASKIAIRHLTQHHPEFLAELISEYDNAMLAEVPHNIVIYIDAQINKIKYQPIISQTGEITLILETAGENISIPDLATFFNEKFPEEYLYCFPSPKQYAKKFKHKYSFQFKLKYYNIHTFHDNLRKYIPDFNGQNIPFNYIYENTITHHSLIIEQWEKLLSNHFLKRENDFLGAMFILLGTLSYLASRLNIGIDDLLKSNHILAQKYMLSINDQKKIINEEKHNYFNKNILNNWDTIYQKNKPFTNYSIRAGFAPNDGSGLNQAIFRRQLGVLDQLIPEAEIIFHCQEIDLQQDIFKLLKISNPFTVSAYIGLANILLKHLPVKDRQKHLLLYIFSKNIFEKTNISD